MTMNASSAQMLSRIAIVLCLCLSIVALGRASWLRAGLSGERQLREATEKAALETARVALSQAAKRISFEGAVRLSAQSTDPNPKRRLVIVMDELSCGLPRGQQITLAKRVASKFGPGAVAAVVVARSERFVRSWIEANEVPFDVYWNSRAELLADQGFVTSPMIVVMDSGGRSILADIARNGPSANSQMFESAAERLLASTE